MGIGVSVFLLAAGAVLYWAVTGDVQGVNLDVVGVILMAAGGIGVLWALIASNSMPWRRNATVERDDRVSATAEQGRFGAQQSAEPS